MLYKKDTQTKQYTIETLIEYQHHVYAFLTWWCDAVKNPLSPW